MILHADNKEGVAASGLLRKSNSTAPKIPSSYPKVAVIWAVPSHRNAVSWDTIIVSKVVLEEKEKKKKLWQKTQAERWIENEPGFLQKPVHMLVMELPWHIVKVMSYDDKTLPPD